MIIQNGLVYTDKHTFEPADVTTDGAHITAIGAADMSGNDEVFDATGCYVIPGLTDVHFHGCDGHDFCDGTSEAFEAIAAFEFSQGVTTICPATMTLSAERLSEICENAARFRAAQLNGDTAKMLLI